MDDTLHCTAGQRADRLDRWLAGQWPDFSRARWQKALTSGLVQINGTVARASDTVRAGDKIEARLPPAAAVPAHVTPEDIPLDILYEDDHPCV